MAGQYTTQIQQLYVAYFNRPADPAGLQYWDSVVTANKGSTTAVSAAFAASAEYTSSFAGLTTVQVVNQIYQNLFGRAAEPGGLLYWSLLLDQKSISLSNAVTQIAGGAQGTDLVSYNSKVTAATAFTNALDTNAEIVGYSGAAALAIARSFLSGVTDATTLAAAIATPALQATTDSIANIGTPGQTFSLTANVDAFVGTANNDSFVSTGGTTTLTALDSIDGGAGNDILQYVQTAAIVLPTSASVKNIETATLTSGGSISDGASGNANVSGWTGLTKLTTIATGGTLLTAATTTAVTAANAGGNTAISGGSNVTVTASALGANATTAVSGAAGNVIVSATGSNATLGAITVGAAGTVSVVQSTTNSTVNTTNNQGSVTVTGGANTTSVSVVNAKAVTATASVAGIGVNTVTITDVNNTSTSKAAVLKDVTVSGYSTLQVNSTGLTSLSASNGGTIGIGNNNGPLASPLASNTSLNLTLSGVNGLLADAGQITTWNITTGASASTLSNINSIATTLNVDGASLLTLTAINNSSFIKTVKVSGAAGLAADLSVTAATSVDTSATTGASTLTIDATKATFTGGAGADRVTVTAAGSTKAISLGDGNDSVNITASGAPTAAISGGNGTDTLTLTAALAATASAGTTFAGLVTGFENLVLTGATNQTVDLAALGNYTGVSTAGGNGLTLQNLPSGGTLTLTGAGTAYTVANNAFAVNTADVLNVALTASGGPVAFASTGITASGVETINVTVADTQTTPSGAFNDTLTLLGNSVKAITVAGNAGLTLTAASTALTSLDASGITLGGFSFTSGALAGASTIKASATGANIVDVSAAVGAVTYTGGSGADTVTLGANTKANVLTLGAGTNTVNGGTANGSNTVTGGANADTVTLGNGNNTVDLGNGANIFVLGNGNNTATGGTGADQINVGSGVNTITTGSGGGDVISFTAVNVNGNSYSTVTDFAGTDVIQLSGISFGAIADTTLAGKITLANTAVFQDFLDAATAGTTAAAAGLVRWFTFNGDTYLVVDNSPSATYQNNVDFVVKLTGTVDLTGADITGEVLTLA